MHALVRDTMLADASLAAILLGGVHWDEAPKGAPYPLVVLQEVSERRDYSLDGEDKLVTYWIQMDLYSLDHKGKRDGGAALKRLWSGHRSDEIPGAFFESARGGVERGTGKDSLLHRASMDFLITVKETEDE